MHEQGLVTALIRRIEALALERSGVAVSAVSVRLGALSHLSPAHFSEHFERAAAGTLAEGARLRIETSSDETAEGAGGILLLAVDVEVPE